MNSPFFRPLHLNSAPQPQGSTKDEAMCHCLNSHTPATSALVSDSKPNTLQNKKKNQQLGQFEPLTLPSQSQHDGNSDDRNTEVRRVRLIDLSSGPTVPFRVAWDLQKKLVLDHLERLSNKKTEKESTSPSFSQFIPGEADSALDSQHDGTDCILMLKHDPVYTLGTASDTSYIKSSSGDGHKKNVDVVRIERGGEVTYHGPGQLVVYPILDLRGYKRDIHWYMRALEEVILVALEDAGVEGAKREDDLTGIWVQEKKVAALGIKIKRWVTMHGLAININEESLTNFGGIVPCGLEGRNVTCVNHHVSSSSSDYGIEGQHQRSHVQNLSVKEMASYVRRSLERVFEIKLVSTPSPFDK